MLKGNDELITYINDGHDVEYICFWGHRKKKNKGVTKSCFSQWYGAPFSENGVVYPTAEHYMMAEKARLFGDKEAEERILEAVTPNEAKKLGRTVEAFNDAIWNENRFAIIVAANMLKFRQNKELNEFLLSTGESVLVEASPVDSVWGIGLAADDKNAMNPAHWKGLNLLGYALMEVRKQLRSI